MNASFDPRRNMIVVDAVLHGSLERITARLLLDTGSGFTSVHPALLRSAGVDLSRPRTHVPIATAVTVDRLPLHIVDGISALGYEARNVGVLAHALPRAARVDGLLGMNFFRNRRLTIDFATGIVTLA